MPGKKHCAGSRRPGFKPRHRPSPDPLLCRSRFHDQLFLPPCLSWIPAHPFHRFFLHPIPIRGLHGAPYEAQGDQRLTFRGHLGGRRGYWGGRRGSACTEPWGGFQSRPPSQSASRKGRLLRELAPRTPGPGATAARRQPWESHAFLLRRYKKRFSGFHSVSPRSAAHPLVTHAHPRANEIFTIFTALFSSRQRAPWVSGEC